MDTAIKPMICGVQGLYLSDSERNFYSKINPLGFALFKKNLLSKKQVHALCCELREVTCRKDTPILVDQEGGKVYRLTQPVWMEFPAPLELGKFAYLGDYNVIDQTIRLVKLNAILIAHEMMEVIISSYLIYKKLPTYACMAGASTIFLAELYYYLSEKKLSMHLKQSKIHVN